MYALSVIVSMVAMATCAHLPGGRIIGGNDVASITSYPWQGSLRYVVLEQFSVPQIEYPLGGQ